MVKLDHVINGVSKYIEAEILPVMSGGRLWGGAFMLGFARNQANTVLTKLLQNPTVNLFGIIDENGNVNIETALEAAAETARHYGKLELDLPLFGKFRFSEDNFIALGEYIKEQAKNDKTQQPPLEGEVPGAV